MPLKEKHEMQLYSIEQREQQEVPVLQSGVWWLKKVEEIVPGIPKQKNLKITFTPPIKVIFNLERELLVYALGEVPINNSLVIQVKPPNKITVMHFRTRDLLEGEYLILGDKMNWYLRKIGENRISLRALFQLQSSN